MMQKKKKREKVVVLSFNVVFSSGAGLLLAVVCLSAGASWHGELNAFWILCPG